MNIIIPIILISGGALAAFILFSKLRSIKTFNLSSEKVRPNISVVLITRNNQKLLRCTLKKLLKLQNEVYEIIVLDVGSIDRSMEVAHRYLDQIQNTKVLNVSSESITTSYLSISSRFFTGDVLFLIDLYRIGTTNPNVYVPDLFTPLNAIIKGRFTNPDEKIDGTKMLLFNQIEREKNNHILKEYITEALSNIRMRMEVCLEKSKTNPSAMDEHFRSIFSYLDSSIRSITLLSRLVGSINYTEKNLDDNMLTVFKDYSYSHKVSINYKILGRPKALTVDVNKLILQLSHDLLHTIIEHNLSSNIEVVTHYRKMHYRLLFKYNCDTNAADFLNPDKNLGYYVLRTSHNQLSLIGGKLRIKTNSRGTTTILIQLPLDRTTCIDLMEDIEK